MSDNPKQAFPDANNSGMTLRDYFAARAMEALICRTRDESIVGNEYIKANEVVAAAYRFSDLMMEERSK